MELAFNVFMEIVEYCFPISLIWSLGGLAVRSIVNALSGKGLVLR